MERIFFIGLAGAAGSISRYTLQTAANHIAGRPTVLGTIAVNLSGAFLLGLLLGAAESRLSLPGHWRVVASTGFFGAYTTFSALMLESIDRAETGAPLVAILNIVASIAFGLALGYGGLQLGRNL